MKRTASILTLVLTLLSSAWIAGVYFGNLAVANPSLSIQILSPVSGELYQVAPNAETMDIPLIFTVNEPVSWIGYFLEPFLPGSQNVTITGNTTVTGVRPSSSVIKVYANDTQGNMASDYVWFTVAHTPIVTIKSPTNNTIFTTNNVPVNITAYDPSTGVQVVQYSLDGGSYAGSINGVAPGVHSVEGSAILTGLPNGRYTLTAVAHAWLTGAVGSSVVYFTVEAQQPSPTLSPSSSPSTSPSPSEEPTSTPEPQQPEPFSIMWTASIAMSVVVIGAGLLVYFKKRNGKG